MTGGDFLEAGHEEQVDRHPVETEKCTGYGLCAAICHEYCMSLADKKAAIDYEACSTCTQCIAICPQKALSWDGVVPPYRLPESLAIYVPALRSFSVTAYWFGRRDRLYDPSDLCECDTFGFKARRVIIEPKRCSTSGLWRYSQGRANTCKESRHLRYCIHRATIGVGITCKDTGRHDSGSHS